MATTIGKPDFPGGLWGAAPDGHVLGQIAPSVAGTVSASSAWVRRDVDVEVQLRMGVGTWDGSIMDVLLGASDVLTLDGSNAPINSWVEHDFDWTTPSEELAGSGDVAVLLHYGPTGDSVQMGATGGGGGGLEWDGVTFASGLPSSLTSPTVRTNSFPLSAVVDTIAGAGPALLAVQRAGGIQLGTQIGAIRLR